MESIKIQEETPNLCLLILSFGSSSLEIGIDILGFWVGEELKEEGKS